jgi:hypothetical protein
LEAAVMEIPELWRILESDPLSLRWRRHGIGFIKAYLDEEKTLRVNVYNKRFLTPNITIHHTHPWHLVSRILSGELENTRYERTAYGMDRYLEGVIHCANYNGIEGTPRLVKLGVVSVEKLPAGAAYVQSAKEIHKTEAKDGTVTLMERVPYYGGRGTARVYWPEGTEYVNADISELSEGEVIHAVSVAVRERL